MAIRKIVKVGDDILLKKCRPVEFFDEKLYQLLDDMHETLLDAKGVGLAAPQVGLLKRVCIVDTGDDLVELINPKVIRASGVQEDYEGCLSYPGKYGLIKRPQKVTVKALNRYGKEFTVSGEDLKARAFCHEIDHLDGTLFLTKATKMMEE